MSTITFDDGYEIDGELLEDLIDLQHENPNKANFLRGYTLVDDGHEDDDVLLYDDNEGLMFFGPLDELEEKIRPNGFGALEKDLGDLFSEVHIIEHAGDSGYFDGEYKIRFDDPESTLTSETRTIKGLEEVLDDHGLELGYIGQVDGGLTLTVGNYSQ